MIVVALLAVAFGALLLFAAVRGDAASDLVRQWIGEPA